MSVLETGDSQTWEYIKITQKSDENAFIASSPEILIQEDSGTVWKLAFFTSS